MDSVEEEEAYEPTIYRPVENRDSLSCAAAKLGRPQYRNAVGP